MTQKKICRGWYLSAISNMATSNVIRSLSDFKNEGITESVNKELKILKPTEQTLSKISEGRV